VADHRGGGLHRADARLRDTPSRWNDRPSHDPHLTTASDAPQTLAFYERNGWALTGRDHTVSRVRYPRSSTSQLPVPSARQIFRRASTVIYTSTSSKSSRAVVAPRGGGAVVLSRDRLVDKGRKVTVGDLVNYACSIYLHNAE
jgi:hypothetical protein